MCWDMVDLCLGCAGVPFPGLFFWKGLSKSNRDFETERYGLWVLIILMRMAMP